MSPTARALPAQVDDHGTGQRAHVGAYRSSTAPCPRFGARRPRTAPPARPPSGRRVAAARLERRPPCHEPAEPRRGRPRPRPPRHTRPTLPLRAAGSPGRAPVPGPRRAPPAARRWHPSRSRAPAPWPRQGRDETVPGGCDDRIAGLIVRTVGVRFGPIPGTTRRRAFTGRRPRRARRRRRQVPRGRRVARRRPSPGPRTRDTSPRRTPRPARATTWRNALRRASGRPGGDWLATAAFPSERRDAHSLPAPERERGERPEQRRRAGRERLVRPRLVALDQVEHRAAMPSDPSAVATTYSTSSGSRLDGYTWAASARRRAGRRIARRGSPRRRAAARRRSRRPRRRAAGGGTSCPP